MKLALSLSRRATLRAGAALPALVLTFTPAGAGAQNLPGAVPDATATGKTVVEQMVVTATRRAQKLIEVPVSITAVGSKEIARTGAVNLQSLAFSAPNVTLLQNSGAPSFPTVSVRGITGRTGIYVDDVVIGNESSYNTYLLGIDRVEFLRGPQGTLFGRNTLGGAINTVTRDPTDGWHGTVEQWLGNYGLVQSRAYVEGWAIPDKLGFSLSGVYRERDGYDRRAGGGDANNEHGFGTRGKIVAYPIENLKITASFDQDYQDPNPYYYLPLQDLPGGGSTTYRNWPYKGERVVASGPQSPNVNLRRIYGYTVKADYNFNDYHFISVTGNRWTKSNLNYDGDYSPKNQLWIGNYERYRQISEELRLVSPAGQRLTWVLGAYYFNDADKSQTPTFVGPDYPVGGATIQQLFDAGAFPPSLLPTPYGISGGFSREANESKALFGNATYHVTDKLSLTFGIRYTADDIRLGVEGRSSSSLFGSTAPRTEFKDHEHNISPQGSIDYAWTPDLHTYIAIGDGYYRGGFNTSATLVEGSRKFLPEQITNYEAGVKAALLQQRLFLTAAGFYEDYTDLQRTQIFSTTQGPVATTTNAGRAESIGFEAQADARPIPGLDLVARLGYQDAHYATYPNAPVVLSNGGNATVDLSGARLPFAPRWTTSLQAQYTAPVAYGDRLNATLGGEFSWRTPYLLNSGPAKFLQVNQIALLNLNAGLIWNDRYSVILRGRNVTNRQYIVGTGIFGGTVYGQYSDPATFTAELTAKF